MKRRLVLIAATLAAAYALPYRLSAYPMQVVDIALIFALLAIGLHLTLGIAGQINLAQVACFGASAYTTALLTTHAGLGFWPAAVLGVLAALAAGLVAGIPALRVQSHYLGIVSLGLAIAFLGLVSNSTLTGGSILGRYGLTGVSRLIPSSLPYGTQRRIEIARAMAAQPRLLLLDEPAAGLNPSEIGELASIIRDIRRDGVTVVLIEHNMGLVMSLCDRVIVFDAGRVIAEGPPEAVANDAAVVSAYLGDANLFDAPSEVGDNDARQ